MFLMFMITVFIRIINSHPDDLTDEMRDWHLKEQSGSQVDTMLTPRQSDSGVVQITLPNMSDPLPVCYPETHLEHWKAAKLVHVFCKQLGYSTFGTRYKEKYSNKRIGVLSYSAQCTGFENLISQCPWKNIKSEMCQEVLATKCSSCDTTIVASNGSIHNPGFPHVYLSSLTCKWTVEVPEQHYIDITFVDFLLPQFQNNKCEAYVELSYGYQKIPTLHRLCSSDSPKNYLVPFRDVRIRFQSGFFKQQNDSEESHYGFNIYFKAVKRDDSKGVPLKAIVISSVFVGVFLLIIFSYLYNRLKRMRKIPPISSPLHNAPTQEQLQAAVEFRRKEILAPKSGSKSMDFSIYHSDSSSMDSQIARWKTHSYLPVTSALAPLGPDRRISIASTPRTVDVDNRRKSDENHTGRLNQLRTKLVARFPSTSSNMSDISVFLPRSNLQSYQKLSSEVEPSFYSGSNKNKPCAKDKTSTSKEVPEIFIEFVE